MQKGSVLMKWDPRSRMGIYLGHSPCHDGNVVLILNLKTVYVSPQFYMLFDDIFLTVPYMAANEVPPNWSLLVQKSESSCPEDYDLTKTWIKLQVSPEIFLSDQEKGGVLDSVFKQQVKKFRKVLKSE